MSVAVVDNYDSFTYNLVQYLAELGAEPRVFRNDQVTVEELGAFDGIVISPGPGTPEDAGVSTQAIRELTGKIAILGVCLGHQAIGLAYGAEIIRAGRPLHGEASKVEHSARGLFGGLPRPLTVGRYHSLIVRDLKGPLEAIAWSEEGEIMALRHQSMPVFGVQFHPESVLTQGGHAMLRNFLEGRG